MSHVDEKQHKGDLNFSFLLNALLQLPHSMLGAGETF